MHNQLDIWIKNRAEVVSHRQLLVISGEKNWAIDTALDLISNSLHNHTLWVGNYAPDCENINVKDYQSKLGQEYKNVILNCFSGFRPNAAIALSGTVSAQGLMVVVCPSLDTWPNFDDPENVNRLSYGVDTTDFTSYFFKYLAYTFFEDQSVALLTQDKFHSPLKEVPFKQQEKLFIEQEQAVQAIKTVANGHRNRPLVITADRGRGKSSALGIAVAELMLQNNQKPYKNILVTAPHIHTIQQVFHHVKRLIPDSTYNKNQLKYLGSTLSFKPIDIILNSSETFDLLLVDEAAAIPIDHLIQLTERFSRIVFSTTIHGYEGSGRGFDIRFKKILAKLKPQFKTIYLEEPIRWYQDDPLESFWFSALFYQQDSVITHAKSEDLLSQPLELELLSKQQLIDSPATLSSIFSLLVDAHYQTSPDDLQRLLDSPDVKCFVIKQAELILGVAQVIVEGGEILEPLANEIASCSRRVKGHLVAQNITSTYNTSAFSKSKQWRITRLAVQNSIQNNGLGKKLIEHIVKSAKQQDILFITSAFGVNDHLLNFWQQASFEVIKLSNKVEVSSGEHNCICVRALTPEASTILDNLYTEFYQELLFQIDKDWQKVKSTVLINILVKQPNMFDEHNQFSQLEMIKQFCAGSRPYAACKRAIHKFIIHKIKALHLQPLDAQEFVVQLTLQNVPYSLLSKQFKLTGKKQIEHQLKAFIQPLIDTN